MQIENARSKLDGLVKQIKDINIEIKQVKRNYLPYVTTPSFPLTIEFTYNGTFDLITQLAAKSQSHADTKADIIENIKQQGGDINDIDLDFNTTASIDSAVSLTEISTDAFDSKATSNTFSSDAFATKANNIAFSSDAFATTTKSDAFSSDAFSNTNSNAISSNTFGDFNTNFGSQV